MAIGRAKTEDLETKIHLHKLKPVFELKDMHEEYYKEIHRIF